VPVVEVRGWFCKAVPVIVGAAVFDGAAGGGTGSTGGGSGGGSTGVMGSVGETGAIGSSAVT
jgi:hypothetical protein